MHKFRSRVLWIGLLACTPCGLSAHESWLFVEEAGSSTTPTSVGMTSGMNFPQVESRVAADRLSRSQLRCPEGVGAVDANRWGSLRLEFQCTQAGWISLEAALEARELTLEADTIEHYFDEIQASAALRAQWQALSVTQPWRERYRKHARLLLWQGSGPVAADWPQAGEGLYSKISDGSLSSSCSPAASSRA